jgi:DNA-binding Xre family transcriptional regulator
MMVDFNNISGKNKGKLQITKLAKYLGKSESTLRALKKKNPKMLHILHLGSLCDANGIAEEDIKDFASLVVGKNTKKEKLNGK